MPFIETLLNLPTAHPTVFGVMLGIIVVIAIHVVATIVDKHLDARALRKPRGYVTIDGGLG
jgi:hypothetical protein